MPLAVLARLTWFRSVVWRFFCGDVGRGGGVDELEGRAGAKRLILFFSLSVVFLQGRPEAHVQVKPSAAGEVAGEGVSAAARSPRLSCEVDAKTS